MTPGDIRFLGIDFSGGVRPWLPRVTNPTVWIATVEVTGKHLTLEELHPVQNLPGSGDGFSKLVSWLGEGKFTAAAIDAPFSIPAIHIPDGEHAELVRRVGWMPVSKGRVFPAGDQLIALANSVSPMTSLKPLRCCETYWAKRGVKVRSTLWNGPRGGAPFTAACLALIAWTALACWPWSCDARPMLVEAFPAAQLRHWGLPHESYSGPSEELRRSIVNALARRLHIPSRHYRLMLDSPDALDAVLAAFAAVAVCKNRVGVRAPNKREEGWIAVHA
jgi:predicted nuclease with RNAse H fold